jgi:hypothetical protein
MPAIMGMAMPRSLFGFGGRAQPVADYDPDSSLRITGRDLFYAPIQAGSANADAGFGGTAVFYTVISPKEVADRLLNIEEIFQWYAIRELRIAYAPATGSTSTVQVSLGYLNNVNIASDITTPTQTQVLEMQPAALFPAWQPAEITVLHRGTKLCSTSKENQDSSNLATYFQGFLASTLLNAVAGTVYGQLWMEYVVDFYQPCPILSTVSRRERLLSSGLCLSHKCTRSRLVRKGAFFKACAAEDLTDEVKTSNAEPADYFVVRGPGALALASPGIPAASPSAPTPPPTHAALLRR